MPSLPESLQAERREALRRVLRSIPSPILDALVKGLGDADELTPGRLYSGESGGCAVGVLVRTLFPFEEHRPGLARRILRREPLTLREVKPELARQLPHLVALEQVFDRTVELARHRMAGSSECQASDAVGQWLAAEAEAELVARRLNVRFADAELQRADAERAEREALLRQRAAERRHPSEEAWAELVAQLEGQGLAERV